jgi:hypothetical protein
VEINTFILTFIRIAHQDQQGTTVQIMLINGPLPVRAMLKELVIFLSVATTAGMATFDLLGLQVSGTVLDGKGTLTVSLGLA